MSRYEFKAIPAPERVRKLKGLEKGEDLFCATITDVITDMGLEGWEYLRSEDLTQKKRRFGVFFAEAERKMFIFRREIARLDEVQPAPLVVPRRVVMADDVASDEGTPRPARLNLTVEERPAQVA